LWYQSGAERQTPADTGQTGTRRHQMQKITTFLWFDDNAEEAINFYTSVFPNSRMGGVTRMPDGKFVTASFVLDGVEFMALNGGPQFTFSEATSLFVNCRNQAEVDELWAKLSEGGEE